MTAVLEIEALTVTYGGVRAVAGLDLTVEPGEIVGLIGPNGAGKTSAVDAISGFTPSGGNVRLAGSSLNRLKPHQRIRAGLARSFQSLELFDDLSVRDNLRVASRRLRWWSALVDLVRPNRGHDDEHVDNALRTLGLDDVADRLPSELSHGVRNLVSVARAVVSQPKVVLLDEPGAGLDSDETEALGARLRRFADEGTAILLIDHDMGLVMSICDRVYVLDFGQLIASGPTEQVRNDPRVLHAYLGEDA
ncbi:MAG: putative transporter ATP-binding protein [Acidimicrobiales bacterium]|nr:putative transporter ATP-binding protein [Acidimicrobiales bacterium]